MLRADGRTADQLRPVVLTRDYLLHPEGSVLVEFGNTKVICTATLEEKVAPWLKGQGRGWVTAEYGMLPRSTNTRSAGRTHRMPTPRGTSSIFSCRKARRIFRFSFSFTAAPGRSAIRGSLAEAAPLASSLPGKASAWSCPATA